MDTRIKRFVYSVRARLREQQIVTNLIKFSQVGMLFAVIVSLTSLIVPFYYAALMATVVLVLSFFTGIFAGIYKTPTPMEAALKADAKGYQEKLSTAFFLRGKEDPFSLLQKRDALRIVDGFQIRKEFPIRLAWRNVAILLLLTAVFVISGLLDTPAKQTANMRHDVKKEAKEEIARLEKVEKEFEKNPELAENEVAVVKEQLERAKKELEQVKSYEDLKKAEERLTKKMQMASKDIKDKTLSEILQQTAQEGEELAQNKKQELAEEAKKALEKAEKGSKKEKEEAYQKLKKLAGVTGDMNLAEVAEEYKESSYSDSKYADASQSLAQTVRDMEKSNSDLAKNSDRNNSNRNNTNSGQNNNSRSTNQNNNQTQNNSQGDNGQGNSGQNGQSGQDGNGSGSDSGNGSAGNGGGAGWNYGGRDGKEGPRKTAENITVPDGEIGNDENLTGKANGNKNSTKEKSGQSKTWSGSKVNYGDVSGKYKDKAYKKVNGSNYPGKLKDKIKDYFNGLN